MIRNKWTLKVMNKQNVQWSWPGQEGSGLHFKCSHTDWARGKEPTCQCRRCKRHSLISRLGRSPGGGNGNSLQYFCLKNPMDKGAWQTTGYGVTESDTTKVT